MTTVAIQGEPGCYHDAAARRYFDGIEVQTLPCPTFEALFDTMASRPDITGIVAMENTIAGPLLQNHELLRTSGLRIAGEEKMRISHVLCALPGQTIDELTEVNSHPMALMQCERFIHSHPNLKAVERPDTAGSAAEIAEKGLTGHGAICSALAAELYGLEILERGIETNKRNFTRFLIVAGADFVGNIAGRKKVDKASIVFTLPHTGGALSKVLAILSFYDMNLTRIQSTPIVGREWEYRFYVDLTFADAERYRRAIDAVRPLTGQLAVLGEYAEGATPEPPAD